MLAANSAALFPGQNRNTWFFVLGYLVAYVVLDWASYIRPLQGLNITPWNPQPALAIALLIWGRRWIWLVWAALVIAEVVVRGIPLNWLSTLSATLALSLAYAALAQALNQKIDLARPLATRRDLLWFAAIITLGSLASAILYVVAFSAAGFGPGGSIAGAIARYWIGDGVGLVVTLPILLLWTNGPGRAALASTLKRGPWWIAAALTCACLWVIFGRGEQDYFKYFYLLLLPVVWASANYGVAGAALSSVFTQLGLIVSAQLVLRHDLTVFELQALMAASSMTALLLGVLVDERERSAAELRKSLRLAAAGQMTAALAHELSQPLTALSNYAQACRLLVGLPGRLDSAQRDQLSHIAQQIVGEAQRAGDVVKRLRDFFRSGATSLRLAPPDAAVRQALEANADFAQSLGVAIVSEISPDLPPVWADPVQIAVVLRNLIANGIESAASAATRQVVVQACLDGDSILIGVRDTGRGVDLAQLHTLFEAMPSAKPGGLGVGLSICRAIVEAHGGKLWAQPGPGGHFFFTLPLDDNETSAAEHTL